MASSKDNGINHRCKIIIIGAGMAGLSAANHLIKNGITNFKILEARDRIGGRIVSTQTDNNKIELGANWIHGVLGNPMYELAMANGLIDIVHVPKPHKVVAAREDGKQIPFKVLQEIYEAYVCFLRRCEEYFLCHYLPPTGINSVGEHIGLEAALYLNRTVDTEERHLRQLIFDCLLKRETCITGCHSMEQIDLMELGSYTELQGGNIVLPSGYSSILEPVSRHIPASTLVTKCPVSCIRWRYNEEVFGITSPGADSGIDLLTNGDPGNDSDDSDKTVTGDVQSRGGSQERNCPLSQNDMNQGPSNQSEEREKLLDSVGSNTCESSRSNSLGPPPNVEVACKDGTRYYADHVICTIPLGVLKDRASELFSPQLPAYKLESINRLLFGTVDKILLEYDRPFLNPDITEVMLLWETEEDSATKNDELNECWFRKIYSFSKISDTLLLGWISGREAEFMETLPHDVVGEKCTDILRKFLNDPCVPKPKLCLCTSWHQQPYTRGSYTAMAVGASQVDIEHLAQPLFTNTHQSKPVLLFAGEHTHSNFYSTVHGAFLTGRSAAQILLTPDSPREIIMSCEDTSDLSSWIQGISLD